MAENQDATFNITFNQMQDTEQEIRALIRQRANLPMQYDSSIAMFNEMTDAIIQHCNDYSNLCKELAIKANLARKPPKYAALSQDSSKMPNPEYVPTTTSDDIPF